jgi:hypothetical protein
MEVFFWIDVVNIIVFVPVRNHTTLGHTFLQQIAEISFGCNGQIPSKVLREQPNAVHEEAWTMKWLIKIH